MIESTDNIKENFAIFGAALGGAVVLLNAILPKILSRKSTPQEGQLSREYLERKFSSIEAILESNADVSKRQTEILDGQSRLLSDIHHNIVEARREIRESKVLRASAGGPRS